MTLDEIVTWLLDRAGRPAAPRRIAEEINQCPNTDAGFPGLMKLARALEKRFITPRRRQLTEQQLGALLDAAKFAFSGDPNASAFPNLNRTQIGLQLMARVLHPGLVNQRSTMLCVPAAGIIGVAAAKPVSYVRFVSELANRGMSAGVEGIPSITARQDVRDYEGPRATERVKEADWIPCASLIGWSRSDIRTSGSGAEALFGWLRGFGFRYLVAMSNFPTACRLSDPENLIPASASLTGESLLTQMCSYAAHGYHVVMLARGELASAIMHIDNAISMHRTVVTSMDQGLGIDLEAAVKRHVRGQGINTLERAGQFSNARAQVKGAEDNLASTIQRSSATLLTDNVGLLRVMFSKLTGKGGNHDFHATYVARIRLDGEYVEIICSNWGEDQRWIRIPKVGFANKLTGFVAAA